MSVSPMQRFPGDMTPWSSLDQGYVLIHMQYLICLVWPTQNQKIIREMGLKWEEMGDKEIVAADGVS